MTDKLLYTHACEMLEGTNVFRRPADSFHYHLSPGDEISLFSLISNHPDIRDRRMSSDQRLADRKNNKLCYKAVAAAMGIRKTAIFWSFSRMQACFMPSQRHLRKLAGVVP